MNKNKPGHLESFEEFLHAAIQNILFSRQVYPPQLFQRSKLFNVPIYECRSPDVVDYIKDVVSGALPWLKTGRLERIAIQLNWEGHAPHDGYFLQLGYSRILVCLSDLCSIERIVIEVASNWNALVTAASVLEVESLLRTFLIKINVLDSHIGKPSPPPNDLPPAGANAKSKKAAQAPELQWQVFAYVSEDTEPIQPNSTFDDVNKFPWVDPDAKEIAFGADHGIVPVRSASLGDHLKMQLFVERPSKSNQPEAIDIEDIS